MNLSRIQPHTWVFLLVGGVVLWLAKTKKLADIFYAMEHGGPSSASNSHGAETGVPLLGQNPFGPNAQPPANWPNASIFGLSSVNSYALGESYSGLVHTEDQQGLTAAGGGVLAHDYDYGLPHNEYVSLPGGKGAAYKLVKQYFDPAYGWLQSWQEPDGGVFNFVHLTQPLPNDAVGKSFAGSDVVGVTGQPLSTSNGVGKHLAVITDTRSDKYLKGLYN